MFERIIKAVEPFGFTLIVLVGASLAGWVNFSNQAPVGVTVFGFGILFMVNHIVIRVKEQKTSK